MNPEQARSIRSKKRLQDQLHLDEADQFDGNYFSSSFQNISLWFFLIRIDNDEQDTLKILKQQEKLYDEEEKEFGKNDQEKFILIFHLV